MVKSGTAKKITGRKDDTNDAYYSIFEPYAVGVTLQGTADIIFHRWSVEDVDEKNKAPKGSKTKKTDNLESYVWRDKEGYICLPGNYFHRAMVEAARFHQDPRSPRKSAKDIVNAGILVTPLKDSRLLINDKPVKDWEYVHACRAIVQRNAINRQRPAFSSGWTAKFEVTSLLPEYITPEFVRKLMDDAGRFIGVADNRPSYGRFVVRNWNIVRS